MQEARREEREPRPQRKGGREGGWPPRKHPEAELGHLEFRTSFCCKGRHGGLVNRCFRAITDK